MQLSAAKQRKVENVESTHQKMIQVLIPLMQMAAVTILVAMTTFQMKEVNQVMIQVERSSNQ